MIDAIGARTDDRIFVMNVWGEGPPDKYRNALAINGRGWPYTERITAQTGDTLRWRIVNGTIRVHPMHLHGFYFTLTARGDGKLDTILPAAQHRRLVTESIGPNGTRNSSGMASGAKVRA